MFTSHSLDILFLTNFSDSCIRGIPAISRIAGMLKVCLTLMHVYDPARSSQADADAQVNSFFPEADGYVACRRIAVPGPLIKAVRCHLEVWPVNLIVAPASGTNGFPRVGHRSNRSRLLKECGVPLWTMDRRVELPKLTQPARNVACWLDFYSLQTGHLAFAMEYANKLNAKLHLLRALPEIHEGSWILGALQPKMLYPGGAAEEILRLCANAPSHPEVHVSCDGGRSDLARMLRECDADVVFLRPEESLLPEWLGLGLHQSTGIPCPAIYVPDRPSVPVWNLDPDGAKRATARAGDGLRVGWQ